MKQTNNRIREEIIKKVANNFLGWKLPIDFTPDCGISYTPIQNSEPIGTNLFTATQTEQMLKDILGKEIDELLKSQEHKLREEFVENIGELRHEIQQDEIPLGNEQWKEGHTKCLEEVLSIIKEDK